MPAHVVEHLIAIGRMDRDGISRRARPHACPNCHALTIVGLDHDRSALTVRADPSPLSPAGELIALLTGRPTYSLHPHGNRYEINPRSQWAITSTPAGTLTSCDVVAAHQCHALDLETIQSQIPPLRSISTAATECPY